MQLFSSPPKRCVQRSTVVSNLPTPVTLSSILSNQKDEVAEADNFEDLGVVKWLIASCAKMGITKPTPIQRAVIPPLLKGLQCPEVS